MQICYYIYIHYYLFILIDLMIYLLIYLLCIIIFFYIIPNNANVHTHILNGSLCLGSVNKNVVLSNEFG